MKKSDFFACSIAFHLILLIAVLLLPSPFPSDKREAGLLYVELDATGKPRPTAAGDYQPTRDPDEVYTPASETGGGVRPTHTGSGGAASAGNGGGSGITGGSRTAAAASGQPQPRTSHTGQPTAQQAPLPPSLPAKPAIPNGTEPSRQALPAQPQLTGNGLTPVNGNPASGQSSTAAATGGVASGGGIIAGKNTINFKYQKGWPPPSMVGVALVADDEGSPWHAERDSDWIIISPASGETPGSVMIGADISKLQPGFYDGHVRIKTTTAAEGDEVYVTLMILPRSAGTASLPHSTWDEYLNGDCKVCHMPENLMPSPDFMQKPEFCSLCHTEGGIAHGSIIAATGGHPVGALAGSGGTKTPSRGSVAKGPKSDMMAGHMYGGKVVCVTCHNVMSKPGEYGRSWELASSESDRRLYFLEKGGWERMGHYVPKVYVAQDIMKLPKRLKDIEKLEVKPSEYTYDEAEGSILFRRARQRSDNVYVSLTNPYLRLSTENNALCFDCHSQNTHACLNCLDCHQAHGSGNIKAVRGVVRGPDRKPRQVQFLRRTGKASFADGSGAGICEVCHVVRHRDDKDYSGTDCTRCHSHGDGFSI